MKKTFVLLFMAIFLVFGTYSEILCVEKGRCSVCKKEDMFNDYCKETGRMIRILCNDGEKQSEEFRSCPLSAEDDQVRVIVFQLAMGLIGGLAYWAAQKRKISTMTLFDSRKLRYLLIYPSFVFESCIFFPYNTDH